MNNFTILDGAMGTMLQSAGMGLGVRPEVFAMQNPDILKEIHNSYIRAGSSLIYACTFSANRHKLEGTGLSVEEVITSNISIARECALASGSVSLSKSILVALDIGPIGELMEPLGTMHFDDAYDIYREMLVAGEKAGADLVVFETFTDLYEAKAAVLAAKENTKLPVWVTMSFEKEGRTFTGTSVESMASTLDGLDVDAMGINCSLGPKEIYPLIKKMREWTAKPLIVKPNAGLPDPKTGQYDLKEEEFGRLMSDFAGLGISILGGCCGTTPDYISEITKRLHLFSSHASDEIPEKPARLRRGICSPSHMTEFKGVRVIGERINPTGKKRFQQALREHDMNYIMERAIEQEDAGADILDINVGLPGIDEPQMMADVVKAVQSVVSLPLQIDSSDPKAIEAGLRYCNGRAIVNSVNADPEKTEQILPIVKKYGAAVIGLTMDKSGIPDSAEKRFRMAEYILKRVKEYGIPEEDLLIDCLTLTISAQQEQALETLKAVRMVHEKLGLHCALGVSNISFGLPKRNHVTTSFLTQAMYCGLDFPIVNPNTDAVMDSIFAFRALSMEDMGCEKYIERFMDSPNPNPNVQPEKKESSPKSLQITVLKGLRQETADLTKELLNEMSELDVINNVLIPALDTVGEEYEKGRLFLPQLINSANAACAGFDIIKERIASQDKEISKGKILIATVEGDIHDIGKNIVKVVLENYGYQVIDLGRDVPAKKIVDEAISQDVHLIGLSALMTTTVDSMKRTIKALRDSGHPCRIFVGGAVLTEDYAMEIGADFYTKDAKASADVAKMVLG